MLNSTKKRFLCHRANIGTGIPFRRNSKNNFILRAPVLDEPQPTNVRYWPLAVHIALSAFGEKADMGFEAKMVR
jgi:hypothetical protein